MKGRIINFTLLICAMLLVLASNCKKQEEQKYMGTYPLGEIKDYLYFKPGSFWVYECDSTGELDTLVLMKIDTPWIIESYIKYQELDRTIINITDNTTQNETRIKNKINYNWPPKYFWYLTSWSNNSVTNRSGTDCLFFFPFDSTLNGGFSTSTSNYRGYLSEITIGKKFYNDIRIFSSNSSSYWPFPYKSWRSNQIYKQGKLKIYFAKNIGIIKYEVIASDYVRNEYFKFNWNLKEYHIEK